MINIRNETIGEIPILHVVQEELQEEALPTVIYYHGYNGEKISSLTLAYKIAAEGYRVILPDSVYHGERKQGLSQTELDLAFWDIVIQNIAELDVIKEYLVTRGYSQANRIGIGGTSMGAITTYSAMLTYDWIKVGASLMGTAYMSDYAQQLIHYFNETQQEQIPTEQIKSVMEQLKVFDLSLQPEKLNDRPLLIWHGEEDKVVSYTYSPRFYKLIQAFYREPSSIRFVSEKGRAHHISRLSMDETTKWFSNFL